MKEGVSEWKGSHLPLTQYPTQESWRDQFISMIRLQWLFWGTQLPAAAATAAPAPAAWRWAHWKRRNKIKRTTRTTRLMKSRPWAFLKTITVNERMGWTFLFRPDPSTAKPSCFMSGTWWNLCYILPSQASLKKSYRLNHQTPESKHISVHTLGSCRLWLRYLPYTRVGTMRFFLLNSQQNMGSLCIHPLYSADIVSGSKPRSF